MLVIDAHLDLAWNAIGWNRDLRQTVNQIRLSEAGMTEKGRQTGTVAFPEMRKGEVGLCLATVLARSNPKARTVLDFRNQEIAYASAQGQLAYYRVLESQGVIRIVKDWPSFQACFDSWKRGEADPPFGFIISMEGADPIVWPGQLDSWWEDGLRVIGLAHYGPSAYAHGTASEGGLTAAGRELLTRMRELGVILDATHMADQSFFEALDRFDGPVLASHNNCRALVPADRQFSDEQIQLLIERDAVIGAAFDAWMIVPGWERGAGDHPPCVMEDVLDHVDHICQLAGSARHCAIGTDLDGGYGTEQTPSDLDTIVDLQKIPAMLRRRGYTEVDIEGIFHGNWLRFFQRAWGG
ncbi:MAG: dipeptidase [Bryobacteraceae bacterium]